MLLLVSTITYSQVVSIDDTLTTQQLVEDVLVNGACVQVSNFSQSTGTNFGSVNGIGAFDATGTDFPFESGVVLTSGNVLQTPGPNNNILSDGGFGWPGDADLEANTTATNTNNASFIQFDFVPSVTELNFEFIMASEEYNETFECTFSDAFAFILTDQATGDVQNLAVLPNTTTPIEVTNIRPEVIDFFGGCAAVNEQFFDRYNFQPVANPDAMTIPAADSPINFNGQTVALTATGSLIVGNMYTIKLVVADETDSLYDIAVFLNANSFDIGTVDLGDDITLGDPQAVCEGDVITLDAGVNSDATFQWFKDGTILPGETNQTLDVSDTGLYRVELVFTSNPDCMIADEILVEFFSNPEFDLGPDQLVCDNNATILNATVTNPSELTNVSYKWFMDGVEIAGETNPTLTVSTNGTYLAEVTGNGCVTTDEIEIEIVVFNVSAGGTISLCGEESFIINPEISGSADLDSATYVWSTGETTPTITVTEDGTYTVDVTIDDCTNTDDVTIIFRNQANVNLVEDFFKCANEVVTITAAIDSGDTTSYTYKWFRDGGLIAGETTSTLDVTETGIYSVEVNDRGCLASDSVAVRFYQNENCIVSQGISPNGDGQNDNLDLRFLDERSDILKLSMFNRNGTLVYEETEYVNQWGGQTNDGAELPVGNYYYVIELERESPITGWVYLNK